MMCGRSVHVVVAILSVASIMMVTTGAQAQDCRNYEDYLCWKPGAELPVLDYSSRNDVDGTSTQLSVVYEDAGFFLFDLADPEDPTIYGAVSPYGGFTSVLQDHEYNWVADADSGLVVINASDWNNMYVQAVENVPAYDIAMTRDYILVAGKEGGFSTCERDVDKPTLQYTIGMPGDAMAVSADLGESYAYVACWDAGLCIVDLETTPPSIVATMDTLTNALSTCVADTILYLGLSGSYGGYGSIEKINISDPLNPVHMESCGPLYPPPGISWIDDRLYITDFGLTVVLDPPNEEHMQVVETVTLQGYANGGGVIAFDGYCYVPTKASSPSWNGGLDIIKKPTHHFRTTHNVYSVAGYAVDLAARGDYVYVLDYDGGVIAVDLTDGSVVDEDWYGGVDFSSIELWGDYLLVTEEYYGLVVYEIVADDDIEYLSDIDLPDSDGHLDVVARGQYAYVAADRKVQIVDLSTPSSPSEAGEIDDFGYKYVHAVDVSGDILYVAVKSSEGYLSVSAYDLGDNPTAPSLLSVVEVVGLDAYSDNVKAAGHMVYLSGPAGLLISDFQDPENPVVKSLLPYNCSNPGLCVSGNWVYTSSSQDGVRVIDASDPENPELVGHIASQVGSDDAYGVLVHGDDVLFVSWDEYLMSGFRQCDDIVDVPEWPGDIGRATLSQNYPNPFNPLTEISFALPYASQVRLEIFNVMGQKPTTLVEGRLSRGHHNYTWDGSGAASGVYFYRLEASGFSETKKMLLLK
ncbi:T9SS type A sorting domain-containing protein [bacterium]|nr:T9SS type A sorting domain-containing protein [bacterium]